MKRIAVAVLTAMGLAVAFAAPARADTVLVRAVDTTDFPEVRVEVSVTGDTPDARDFQIRENNRLVADLEARPIREVAIPVGVVLVIDVSGSMRANDKLEAAKAAAIEFVNTKLPTEQIALVSFSDEPRVSVPFTSDAAQLNAAISGLAPIGETALYDGVRTGATLLSERPDLQPNLVLLSDGKDTVSKSPGEDAAAAVRAAKASVFSIGLRGGRDFDAGTLQGLVGDSGGEYAETTDPRALTSLFGRVRQAIENQWELVYQSSGSGALNLEVTVNGVRAQASANAGSLTRGIAANPEVIEPRSVPGVVTGDAGIFLIAVLVLIAAALLAAGVILLLVRGQTTLESALQPYIEQGDPYDEREVRSHTSSLAETAIMQRAVDVVERFAERRGFLDQLGRSLEQADIRLRAGEALFFTIAGAVVMTLLGLAIEGLFLGFIAALVFGYAPFVLVRVLARRRRRRFTSQLPDTLQLLASSLRAGYSVMQGIQAVSEETQQPMAKELRRVVVESQLGRPVDEALQDAADRMGSKDFDWAVMAVRIQREVGGNLAELLDTVTETMVARERLRREVRALTAEGRISAVILGALPVFLGMVIYTLNPDYVRVLFTTSSGKLLVAGSIVLAMFGFYWMYRIIDMEI